MIWSRRLKIKGSFPTVVTNEKDWGGWRVPGAEYDLDPHNIEMQARIIVNALPMLSVVQKLVEYAEDQPENIPQPVGDLAKIGDSILKAVLDTVESENAPMEPRDAELESSVA